MSPLAAAEARESIRSRQVENMLHQWDEVFGRGDGKITSPLALMSELQEYKKENERLRADLEAARLQASQAERSCLEVLSQHHKAHADERERE